MKKDNKIAQKKQPDVPILRKGSKKCEHKYCAVYASFDDINSSEAINRWKKNIRERQSIFMHNA